MAAIDRYRTGYLHLFYEDYLSQGNSNFNPYSQVQQAKQTIQQVAAAKIKSKIGKLQAPQPDIEELYNLKEGDFSNLGGDAQERWNEANIQMSNFDAAIAELKKLFREKDADLDYASYLSDLITTSIDNILLMGEKTNGLASAAIDQIKLFKNKYDEEVLPHLKHVTYYSKKQKRNSMINALDAVQSNVSGYMLELANVYAFLGANAHGLKSIINIGGANKVVNGVRYTIDPNLLTDYEKIEQALQENNGQQSKADNILIFNMSEGNGSIIMTTSYVGLQNKNITDISRVKVTSYTLGQLGIGTYYSPNFLANTAGGLAGTKFRAAAQAISGIKHYRTHKNVGPDKENSLTQTYVDELWANIKDSVRILGVADAIAGQIFANVTNKIDYYVVRSKMSGQIRVIPTAEILQQLFEKNKEMKSTDKINFISGKNQSRERYWTINYQNFVPDEQATSRADAAVTRSNRAYSAVLREIMNTKIQISINFSNWF